MANPPRNSDKHDTQGDSPHKDRPSKVLPSVISPNLDTEETEEHNHEPKSIKKPPVVRLPITDWIMVVATCIIAYATATYTGYAKHQWRVMEKQTVAAFQQLSTAKNSIRIADEALKDARDSGKEQSDRAERLTKANEVIARTSKKSVDTTRELAKKSLDATIENFRLEQRAWVGLTEISCVRHKEGDGTTVIVKEEKSIKCKAIVTNTGKTPARDMITRVYLNYMEVPNPNPKIPEKAIMSTEPTSQTLFPGNSVLVTFPFPSDKVFAKDQIESLKNGQNAIYLYGMIVYRDVFGETHFTKFCAYVLPSLTNVASCPSNNDAN